MALALLKRKVAREGFLKKTASAKGKDAVRGKWQERWFILNGPKLFYYKRKGDSSHKGIIDLRAALVDTADEKTDRSFTIRIAQSAQVFNYLQCASAEDRDGWLLAIRKAAGYKVEALVDSSAAKAALPKSQKDGLCSLGALVKTNAAPGSLPSPVVILCDASSRSVKIFSAGKLQKEHPASTISHVQFAEQADTRNAVTNRLSLFSVMVDFKAANYLTRRDFFVGSASEAKSMATLLRQMGQGNFSGVTMVTSRAPFQQGPVQIRADTELAGDKAGAWQERHVVLVEQRALIYTDRTAPVPESVLFIEGAGLRPDGKIGLAVQSANGETTTNFRFSGAEERDAWVNSLRSASKSLKDQIDAEVKGATQELLSAPASNGVPGRHIRGLSRVDPRHIPGPPPPGAGQPVRILGAQTFCALGANEATYVASWGANAGGQLGQRNRGPPSPVPKVLDVLQNKQVRYVSAGGTHAVAVTVQGHVYSWGDGPEFQLGLGDRRLQSSAPFLVTSLRSSGIVRVSCGYSHTLALSSTGDVYAWGSSPNGQLGHGSTGPSPYPQVVEALAGKGIGQVAAGAGFSVAVSSTTGDLFVWGDNRKGQLGLGHHDDSAIPVVCKGYREVSGGGCEFVACGGEFTAAVSDKGQLYTTGDNSAGQLGLGDVIGRNKFEHVAGLKDTKVVSVACGLLHTVCLAASSGGSGGDEQKDAKNNAMYAWGAAKATGFAAAHAQPVPVAELANAGIAQISSSPSSHHTVLLSSDSSSVYRLGVNPAGGSGYGWAKVPLSSSLSGVAGVCCGVAFSAVLCKGQPPAGGVVGDNDSGGEKPCAAAAGHATVAVGASSVEEAEKSLAEIKAAGSSHALADQEDEDGDDGFTYDVEELKAKASISDNSAQQKIGALLSAMDGAKAKEAEAEKEKEKEAAVEEAAPKKKKKKKKKARWKEVKDPKTGKTYYYHNVSRETRWTKPEVMEDDE